MSSPSTSPPPTQHQVKPGKPELGIATVVTPAPGSRLDQLAAEHDRAKAELAAAEARLKTITDGIKSELTTAAPGLREVLLSSPYLERTLQLQFVESWRVDAKVLKAADPETYVRWAKKSTTWRLAPMR